MIGGVSFSFGYFSCLLFLCLNGGGLFRLIWVMKYLFFRDIIFVVLVVWRKGLVCVSIVCWRDYRVMIYILWGLWFL